MDFQMKSKKMALLFLPENEIMDLFENFYKNRKQLSREGNKEEEVGDSRNVEWKNGKKGGGRDR